MKVLHLIPALSGGGAERQLSYLAMALVEMGHEVHIAYGDQGPNEIDLPGVTLHPYKAFSNYDPRIVLQLASLMKKIKPDIVHTWILQMDVLGGMVAAFMGIPWIIREPSSRMNYLPSLKNKLRVFIGRRACAVVSNSNGGDEYWNSRIPAQKRFIIHNGLPNAIIQDIMPGLPEGLMVPDTQIVLFVGRLSADASANKNLKNLLEALALIMKQREVYAILCGEGPQRAELEGLAKELNLEHHVGFTGHIASSSVWALMKKASVFVSLSAYEGCPNAVIEAMACKCPLVLSDIPAHQEICDTFSTLFVDPANIAQIAEAIQAVLNSDEKVEARVENAYQRSQKWSIGEMARNYEKVYAECIRNE